ncbi:MAG: hypothetical protein IJV14_07780 [Lachnospiraceae bacterium]|nr:hypothetical protein [Lachnospiraceae bacterium]
MDIVFLGETQIETEERILVHEEVGDSWFHRFYVPKGTDLSHGIPEDKVSVEFGSISSDKYTKVDYR